MNQGYDKALETTLNQALRGYQRENANNLRSNSNTITIAPDNTSISNSTLSNEQHQPAQSSGRAVLDRNGHFSEGPISKRSKFGSKKKSWVWNWFVQDPNDLNSATCDYCNKIIVRTSSDKGSPKKFKEHLKTHKIVKDAPNPNRRTHYSGGNSTQSITSSNLSGPSITASISSSNLSATSLSAASSENTRNHWNENDYDDSPYCQAKFQKSVLRFLHENKLPLTIVKSPSFKHLIYTLRPESIYDLNELHSLYSSLIQVMKNDEPTGDQLVIQSYGN